MVDEGSGAIGYYYYYYSGETGVVDFRGVEPLVVCPSLTSAKEESEKISGGINLRKRNINLVKKVN